MEDVKYCKKIYKKILIKFTNIVRTIFKVRKQRLKIFYEIRINKNEWVFIPRSRAYKVKQERK